MADRGNQGENNLDGYYYQHNTMIYCIQHLMKYKNRFPGYEIGSAMQGYGSLDDVVLHVTLPDKSKVTNLLQVKHSNKSIHEHYLCYNDKTYIGKYFDTFLGLARSIPLEQLDQLIIWTNMSFTNNVKDWFEPYVPTVRDILGDSVNLPYQRFQFRKDKFREISFHFHTRMKLVYEIVDGLFNKQKWDPTSAAKSYYLAMAKQIIEGNGVDIKFKEEFINGRQELLDEKDRFRKCFKVAMERKFIRQQIKPEFSMEKLNSDEYRRYFGSTVDTNVKVHWEEWKTEEDDLEEFRKRLVFYVEVPKVDELKTHLINHVSCFAQVSELLDRCAFEKMINRKQFESLMSLIKLRKLMDIGPYTELRFDDSGSLPTKVITFLGETISETCLHVNTMDVYCTISRLISPVKIGLGSHNDRYLVMNRENFRRHMTVLQTILEEQLLVKNALKCIIIADVRKDESHEIETKLSPSGVKAILVGKQLDNGFEDTFDIMMLDSECKEIINNREIYLSELQEAKASEIFGDALFQKENCKLALDLFKTKKPIQLVVHELHLDEHFRERKVKHKNTTVLELMGKDEYQQIIISDQAGMGKSTELINIAIEMQKTYNDHLVVCLDCKYVLRHHDKKRDIGYIICKMTSIKGLTKEITVRKIIELGKIILLLDGIDEVSDSCRPNLEELLKTISKTRLSKLVIATRPHCSTLIQQMLPSSNLFQLEPFSKSDQLEYLKSFWKINELADANDRTKIEENARELIDTFRSMLKDGSFIGIPLQTHMIAVIYQTSITSPNFEQPKPYKIGEIYKQFIELRFQESIKRQFDLTTKAHENAIRIQLQKFVPDHITIAHKIYTSASESELNTLSDHLQTYGLVRLHPSVGFSHFTYLEYFLSLYYLTYVTNASQEFLSFMNQNLCASRESIVTKFMDFHIDEIDPSRKLETDNTTTDSLPDDFTPPPTGRLHPDKLREFHFYLLNHCSEAERFTLIRNSFNLSVFNVFEVLYDTLPTDTKSALKFRFGNKPEPNFVNLKLLGRNQVLQLLNILLQKNAENFVQLYLTDFADDEEDFLEVACRKPFVQVLDWLVNKLIPNLNRNERDTLNSYVQRRFSKYIQLVVKHNNALFLQRAIQRAEEHWTTTAISCFLSDHNVLQMFLNTVELPSDTKPLKVEQRAEMVRHLYDLHQWAFDGQFRVSDDCRNMIANLQIDSIQRAFNDTFTRNSAQ